MNDEMSILLDKAREMTTGIALFGGHPEAGLGRRHTINLWIPHDCLTWGPEMKLPNCDLAILIAYKLHINWGGVLNIITVVDSEEEIASGREKLERLGKMARIPVNRVLVVDEDFEEFLEEAPQADLNVFNLPFSLSLMDMKQRIEKVNAACLYCRDSTEESALA